PRQLPRDGISTTASTPSATRHPTRSRVERASAAHAFQALGHGPLDQLSRFRMLLLERAKGGPEDHEQLNRGRGRHSGVSATATDDCHLAEKVARVESLEAPVASVDVNRPREDDEEAVTGGAFACQHVARARAPQLTEPGDLAELGIPQICKQ